MLVCLTYHSVTDREYNYSISPDVFEAQLKYIKSKFKIISAQDLERLSQTKGAFNENYALITFDDGVKDNYSEAFPILKKLNVPAAIFVTTLYVGREHTNAEGVTSKWLSWDDMRDMKQSGLVSIENHTHTHPLLDGIDKNEIKLELETVNSLFKTELGETAKYFAYPKGVFNAEIKEVIRPYFRLAFGSEGVVFNFKQMDALAVPRITITRDMPNWKFKAVLNPWFWRLKKIKNKLV